MPASGRLSSLLHFIAKTAPAISVGGRASIARKTPCQSFRIAELFDVSQSIMAGCMLIALAMSSFPNIAYSSQITLLAACALDAMDGRGNPPVQRDGIFETLGWDGDPSIEASIQQNFGWTTTSEGRFAIEFDIRGIPEQAVISAAVLRLVEVVDGWGQPTHIQMHGYAGDGVIDGNDMVQTNLLYEDISDGLLGAVELDVATFVGALRTQGAEFVGFSFREVEGFQMNYYQVWSRSAAPSASWPHAEPPSLAVSFAVVPELSTYAMALAGLACGGFSMWRRRKRA